MTSKEKVAALREEMQKNNVDAFIVYSADPHMSEYFLKNGRREHGCQDF
jgi:Xaa-Pro aminopeptidase